MSAAAKRATWRGSSGRSLAAADLLGAVILPFKRVAKRDAEGTLHALAAPARLRRRAIVLAYHNIVPDDRIGGGDRSLHLARHDFAAQLDLLQHTHDIVPLTELLDADASPASRTRAAITFDDAYREAITVGLPELAHHEIPRTVFVAPGYLDGGTFWWEELSAPGTGLEPGVRDVALDALGGDDHAVGEWACGTTDSRSLRPSGSAGRRRLRRDRRRHWSGPGDRGGTHVEPPETHAGGRRPGRTAHGGCGVPGGVRHRGRVGPVTHPRAVRDRATQRSSRGLGARVRVQIGRSPLRTMPPRRPLRRLVAR